ncbi:uncharacterized protein ACR2FA_006218 [Aphomia sociella]
MSVPIVKKCCCCVNLRTATLVIGCLFSIWTLAELIIVCVMVTLVPLGKDGNVSRNKQVLYLFAVGICCVQLLFSLLLIIAAIMKRPCLTLPWTIVSGIISATEFIIVVMGFSLLLQDFDDLSIPDVAFVVIHFVRACVSSYCIVIVHSFHKEMMNKPRLESVAYNKVTMEDNEQEMTIVNKT